jgi:hypothetical protein
MGSSEEKKAQKVARHKNSSWMRVIVAIIGLGLALGCRSAPQTRAGADEGSDEHQGVVAEVGTPAGSATESGVRRVIMVSIDGCRWDYLEDPALENLRAMRKSGASASQVIVTTPSMTAPGHITLITGAWAGTHGVVFNKFYDREQGFVKFFGGIKPEEQIDWLLAEPIWATAERAELKTASVHWAATAGTWQGQQMDNILPFEPGRDDSYRFSEAIKLFREERPHLLLVYTTGVSSMTYKHGVGSTQVRDRLEQIDARIGELLQAVRESDMAEETNVVVVSDHGFGAPLKKEICISWLLDREDIGYDFILWGAVGQVFLKDPGQAVDVRDLLAPLEGVEKVLLRSEADDLHLATEHRTGDVLIVASPGYQAANMWRECDAAIVDVQPGYDLAGTHGQPAEDNTDMRGIFIAAGPHINQKSLGVVKQIDIAPTVSALLGIDPPTDADGQAMSDIYSLHFLSR